MGERQGRQPQWEDAIEVESNNGYLRTVVETHKRDACKYKKKKEVERKSGSSYYRYDHSRVCTCSQEYTNGVTEYHYENSCRWRKIKDEESGFTYLCRKCTCQPK